MGHQFLHVSMPWEAVASSLATAQSVSYAGAVGFFVNVAGDGGPDGSVGPVPISTPSAPLAALTGESVATAYANLVAPTTGFEALAVGADGGAIVNPVSSAPLSVMFTLDQIQRLSYGNGALDAGSMFKNGESYAFILVGDPSQPFFTDAGVYNAYNAHILAFPTDPPQPK
jgi:hypothetical protein